MERRPAAILHIKWVLVAYGCCNRHVVITDGVKENPLEKADRKKEWNTE